MKVLRQRNGQALLKIEDKKRAESTKYEWWYDLQKMKDGIRIEEIDNKTYIYCYIFKGYEKESWLMDEFDRRVPKTLVV